MSDTEHDITSTQQAIRAIQDGTAYLVQHVIELENQIGLLLAPTAPKPLFVAGDRVIATDMDVGGFGTVDYVGKPTHLLPVLVAFDNGHREWFSADGRRSMSGQVVLCHAPLIIEVEE